eukprot:COSAG01_NODE_26392_length_715_cov_1.685065_1_plen_113_part_00
MSTIEVFKKIRGFPDYRVSTHGRLLSDHIGKFLRLAPIETYYRFVTHLEVCHKAHFAYAYSRNHGSSLRPKRGRNLRLAGSPLSAAPIHRGGNGLGKPVRVKNAHHDTECDY